MVNDNRRNIIILSIALVVVSLGFGVVIPIFPFYISTSAAAAVSLACWSPYPH